MVFSIIKINPKAPFFMNFMKSSAIIIFSFLIAFPVFSAAGENTLWEQKIAAQIEFQNQIAELMRAKAPELEEVIFISRDLQIVYYAMKRERYRYLIDNFPGRIDPDQDLNFEWTGEDEDKLIHSNKKYSDLAAQKKNLKTKKQGHAMWPAVREVFSSVRKTDEFIKLTEELMEILKK